MDVDMEQPNKLLKKLKIVLKSFLNEEFRALNGTYFEQLISKLSGKNGYDYSSLLHDPYILEWIGSCVEILEHDFTKLQPCVIGFMIKIVALVVGNEWLILQIRDRSIMARLQEILVRNRNSLTPTIKLAHVRLLCAFSNYTLGIRWIRDNQSWHFLIQYCTRNHTVYVVREATVLIYDILYKLSVKTNDEEPCEEMLREILDPIRKSVYDDSSLMVNVDDSELQQRLGPTLDLISYILEKTLESEEKTNIAFLCIDKFNLETNVWKLAKMTQNQQFLRKILKTLCCLNFAQLVFEKWTSGKISDADFNQFGVNFFNVMKFCVLRKAYENFLKCAELNHVLWHKLGSRAPEEILIENERIQFENQMILFHLLPVVLISKPLENEEYAYSIYDSPEKAAELAYKSINEMMSMENILNKDRAVLIFQAMCHALKVYTSQASSQCKSSESTLVVVVPNVLYAILVGLQTLIKKYRITWKESIETTCLLNLLLDLLDSSFLSPRISVQAIKLTQLTIEHFLSPNMALLVDNLKGSGLQNLGPIIMKRFHDTAWEIRDSILELVSAITSISLLKYPVFQQYILEHEIAPVVFTMAKNDCEPYVRASALKCLTQMVSINLLWEKALQKLNIADYLLNNLCADTEGIVRKEAVMLLTNINNIRGVSQNHTNLLFSTMAYCAVNDLHWEVKINALYFWKMEMCRQFTNQGMIDGTFPTVTFSKEYKKIVTLTDKEILLRIQKILNELSRCGCLGVISACLDDNCDLEVVKIAVLVTNKLLEKLRKYDYMEVVNIPMEPQMEHGVRDINNQPSDRSTEIHSDETNGVIDQEVERVIQEIVSSQDINLLASAYENQMNVSETEKHHHIDEHFFKTFTKMEPTQFIQKVSILKLDLLVQGKKTWFSNTESLNSLLGDMIYSTKYLNVNDADCY